MKIDDRAVAALNQWLKRAGGKQKVVVTRLINWLLTQPDVVRNVFTSGDWDPGKVNETVTALQGRFENITTVPEALARIRQLTTWVEDRAAASAADPEAFGATDDDDTVDLELSIAAGDWADVSDVDGAATIKDVRAGGSFTVRISGRSMEPDWNSGDKVRFRVLTPSEVLQPASDYYVLRDDGRATFKRFVRDVRGKWSFKPRNAASSPKELDVPRSKVEVVAIAEKKIESGGKSRKG